MQTRDRQPLTESQVIEALEGHGCSVIAAAHELGVTRQGLYDAMRRFELEIVVNKVVRRKPAAA